MSGEDAPHEVPLPVPIAFIVTGQKAVAIGLLICRALPVGWVVSTRAVDKEVRAERIVTFATAGVIGAGKQAFLISALIGAQAVTVAIVVSFIVDGRVDVVRIVRIAITVVSSSGVLVTIAIAVFVTIAAFVAITIFVTIAVFVPVAIFVTVAIFAPVAIFVLVTVFVFVAVSISVPAAIPVAAAIWISISVPVRVSIRTSGGIGRAGICWRPVAPIAAAIAVATANPAAGWVGRATIRIATSTRVVTAITPIGIIPAAATI